MIEQAGTHDIVKDREELFKVWIVRACVWGMALFVGLGTLDYFAYPERFAEFLWYRAHIAVALAVIAFVSRTYAGRPARFHERLGQLAVFGSAAAIELMVLRTGGHASLYSTGQILLGVSVLGFVPSRMTYHAGNALIIYLTYLVPILLFDDIIEPQPFIIANGFILSVFCTSLVLRALTERTLDRQLSLQAALAGSERKYRDLFENATEAIFVLDERFRYVDANRTAEELSGYSREELRQRTLFDLVPPEDVARSADGLAKLRTERRSERVEGRMRRKDGSLIDIEVSSSAIVRSGRFAGSRDAVRDISDRKRIQDELRRSHGELEKRVEERAQALLEMNRQLQEEIAERRKAEQRIGQQLERQRALSTVERSIASSLNLSVTLNVFIDQVMAQLKTDAAAVMLYDREQQELSFAASRGFRSNRIMKVTVKAGRSLAGTVIARQSRIVLPDLEQADLLYPSPDGYLFKNSFLVKDEAFRSYIGIPLTVKGEVKGILEVFHRRPCRPAADWLEFLDALSQQASIAIDNASMYALLQRSHAEISLAYDKTIEGWSRALDIRDNDTHGHSQRVTDLTVRLARELGVTDGQLVHIRRGALLHDIGKLGVPDSILRKPGRLSDEEMAVMKRHTEIAYDILSPIPFLREALDIPYLHHERWDGSGYPRGMNGDEIPLAARIFAVIDVWDALRTDRPYRRAWDEQRVRDYLLAEQGRQFDPEVVKLFLRAVGEDGN